VVGVVEELQNAHTDEDTDNVSHVLIHNGSGAYSRFICIIMGMAVGLGIGDWVRA
jgi:hypothetical protein